MIKIIGIDSGTTGTKGVVIDEGGKVLGKPVTTPEDGVLPRYSPKPNFSEQDPRDWSESSINNIAKLAEQGSISPDDNVFIGVSAQMHGLGLIDKNGKPVRRGIIWDDTRTNEESDNITVAYGRNVGHMTVAKALWVKNHEENKFNRAQSMLLPEDYIVFNLTGKASTTQQGVSQMRAWDFAKCAVDLELLKVLGLDHLLPTVLPNTGDHGQILEEIAEQTGLPKNTRVTARLGDQQSSATGVGAVKIGYVGLTAGSSGVINVISDARSDMAGHGVYKFLHGNNLGLIIACTFGCGLSYQYGRDTFCLDLLKDVGKPGQAYELMNREAAKAPPGAGGLVFLPYGNNGDRSPINDSSIRGALISLDYNIFGDKPEPGIQRAYVLRAILEGIAHSFRHNQQVLDEQGVKLKKVRAAKAGVLTGDLFAQMVADDLGVPVEFVNTEGGCYGVALAAAVGAGIYKSIEEACERTIHPIGDPVKPDRAGRQAMLQSYARYLNFYEALAPVFQRMAKPR